MKNQTTTAYITSLNTTKENRAILEYLFQSELIMQRFKKTLASNDGVVFFAVCELLTDLMAEQNVTLEQFVCAYVNDEVEAIQALFMRPVSKSVIDLIKVKSITPCEIFNKHKEDAIAPIDRVVSRILADKAKKEAKGA